MEMGPLTNSLVRTANADPNSTKSWRNQLACSDVFPRTRRTRRCCVSWWSCKHLTKSHPNPNQSNRDDHNTRQVSCKDFWRRSAPGRDSRKEETEGASDECERTPLLRRKREFPISCLSHLTGLPNPNRPTGKLKTGRPTWPIA